MPSSTPTLVELRQGEQAYLADINLPEADARRLMELGFLPGSLVTVALRRETASRMTIHSTPTVRQDEP